MLKKKINYKKPYKIRLKKKITNFFKTKKYTNYKFFELSKEIFIKSKVNYKISIKITPNNIFCTLQTIKNKTIIVLSAGMIKINVSKKKLKFASKIIIDKFIKNLKTILLKNNTSIINITGPKKLRKNIYMQLFQNLQKNKNKLILNFEEKKCFNGCKAKKKKRKKRKGLRVYK